LGKKTKTKKTCLSALKNVAMLGETNNQFYMALVTINLIGRFPPPPPTKKNKIKTTITTTKINI
jgi:hypothetical protein